MATYSKTNNRVLVLLLLAAVVSAQTYWTDLFLYLDRFYVFKGLFLGAMESVDNRDIFLCWEDLDYAHVHYLILLMFSFKTNPVQVIIDYLSFGIELAEVFETCRFNELLIKFGTYFDSIHGATSGAVSLGYAFITFFNNAKWKQEVRDSIDYANIADSEYGWEMVGFHFGEFLNSFLGFEIPSYDYHGGVDWFKNRWADSVDRLDPTILYP